MREDCDAETGLNMLMVFDIWAVNKLVAKHKAWKPAKDEISNATLPAIEVPKLTKKLERLLQVDGGDIWLPMWC